MPERLALVHYSSLLALDLGCLLQPTAPDTIHHTQQGYSPPAGYVRTDMTGGQGLINVDECVAGLISVLESDRPLNGRW